MKSRLEAIYKESPERFLPTNAAIPILRIGPPLLNKEPEDIAEVPAKHVFPKTAANEDYRQKAINSALDAATYDMRLMAFSKTAMLATSEGKITVVEPGGRGYYRWQVHQAFCGTVPEYSSIMVRVKYPEDEWPLYERPGATLSPDQLKSPPKPERVHPLSYSIWNGQLREPEGWKRLLFEGILYQPLGGGKFIYDSESLEALSIIED